MEFRWLLGADVDRITQTQLGLFGPVLCTDGWESDECKARRPSGKLSGEKSLKNDQ